MSAAAYTVEGELWKIFTYYALHADPTQPEMLKVAQFIRFCKDCQILSSKVTGTIVELGIAEIIQTRRNQGTTTRYSTSATLRFQDFVSLLEILSTKVYSKCNPDVAMRRLLLENVFVLSGRCTHVQQQELCDEEAMNTLQVVFGKTLQSMFNHYVSRADVRRNIVLSGQFESRRSVGSHLVPLSPAAPKASGATGGEEEQEVPKAAPTRTQQIKALKDEAKDFHGTIGYEEYSQFCHDYDLKSTNLLTALQVGDIFLRVVPYDPTSGGIKGMSFSDFCKAILLMAVASFRELREDHITTTNKVMGFLLYMWKAISSREKASKGLNVGLNGSSREAISGNLHGSGPFCEQFLSIWQQDGFSNYVVSSDDSGGDNPQSQEDEGLLMLHRIVYGTDCMPLVTEITSPDTTGGNVPSNTPENCDEEVQSSDKGIENKGELQLSDLTLLTPAHPAAPIDPIQLSSDELKQLFLMKPEIAELIHLEIIQQC